MSMRALGHETLLVHLFCVVGLPQGGEHLVLGSWLLLLRLGVMVIVASKGGLYVVMRSAAVQPGPRMALSCRSSIMYRPS